MAGLAAETDTPTTHLPVMVPEVMMALPNTMGGSFIDCNLGDGGHAEAILRSIPGARLLGIDLDFEALQRASKRLDRWSDRLSIHHGNFGDVAEIAAENIPTRLFRHPVRPGCIFGAIGHSGSWVQLQVRCRA